MLVHHGKTLNIFPRLSRTTKNPGLSRMWQPCKKCGVSICDIACTGFSNDLRRGERRSGQRGSSFGKLQRFRELLVLDSSQELLVACLHGPTKAGWLCQVLITQSFPLITMNGFTTPTICNRLVLRSIISG